MAKQPPAKAQATPAPKAFKPALLLVLHALVDEYREMREELASFRRRAKGQTSNAVPMQSGIGSAKTADGGQS